MPLHRVRHRAAGRPTTDNTGRGEGSGLTVAVEGLVVPARVPVMIETDPARLRPADVPWLVGDPAPIARGTSWHAEVPIETTPRDVLEEWRERK